jgi:hypothetical protein
MSALLAPRCGKAMMRYEAANGPMPEPPVCARPQNHAGMCRSAASLARKQQADTARITAARRAQRYGRPWLRIAALDRRSAA